MRKYWGKTGLPLPEIDLLSVQKEAYDWLLTEGISMALREISPITDQGHKIWELTFGKHWLEKPVLTLALAVDKRLNYEATLKAEATLRNLKTK